MSKKKTEERNIRSVGDCACGKYGTGEECGPPCYGHHKSCGTHWGGNIDDHCFCDTYYKIGDPTPQLMDEEKKLKRLEAKCVSIVMSKLDGVETDESTILNLARKIETVQEKISKLGDKLLKFKQKNRK